MDSTQEVINKWKFVVLNDRDILLFKTILEQKFLTRVHVMEHVFEGKKSYAEIRIRKLKMFGYLKAVRDFVKEPESYLLTELAVEALRERGYVIRTLGFGVKPGVTLPEPQTEIERACYEHDVKVTNIRFLFESLGFCEDWQSEKVLKLGQQGEHKVPDGYFTVNGKGIAVEFERRSKNLSTYRKIFSVYTRDKKIDYIFYICGDLSIRKKLMGLIQREGCSKTICLALYDNLMGQKEDAAFKTSRGEFKLKAVLGS